MEHTHATTRIALGAFAALSLGIVLAGCQSSSSPTNNQQPTAQTQPAQKAAFTLDSKKDRKLTDADLKKAQKNATKGKVSADGGAITFDQKDISLVATTGPEDDMLSFRIQGVRNPTLHVPAGAKIKVLFVNADDDMTHDFLIGQLERPIPDHPSTAGTVGSDRTAHKKNDMYSAQKLSFDVTQKGVTNYFCSVSGHAKGGMWGTIVVGKVDSSQKVLSGHDAGEPHNHASHMDSDHSHSDKDEMNDHHDQMHDGKNMPMHNNKNMPMHDGENMPMNRQ